MPKGVNMFKRRGINSTEALAVAERMPPLRWLEAATWLSSIQQVQYMVFYAAKDAGVIVYDPLTENWLGRSCAVPSNEEDDDAQKTGREESVPMMSTDLQATEARR